MRASHCLIGAVFGACVLVVVAAASPSTTADPALEVLWPMPKSVTHGDDTVALAGSDTFSFKAVGVTSDLLDGATKRYMDIIFSMQSPTMRRWQRRQQSAPATPSATLASLDINVLTANETLGLSTDESYTLTVDASGATLTAHTVFGAMRGLETFSQLTTAGASGVVVNNAPWSITDAPRWPHRGLLVDSSRHFLTMASLEATIDAIAYSKLNVLHWHIVDAQSFPFQSESYPNLTAAGAYNSQSVYSHTDVTALIQYGLERGVRIIMEFDTPAHTYAWGLGYEKQGLTMCGAAEPWSTYCAEPPCGQLDPTNDFTYELVGGLWKEVAGLTPDEFVHIGGDEVNAACWGVDSAGAATLMGKYVSRLQPMVSALGKGMIQWQGAFDAGVRPAKDTVIQLWKPDSFRAILDAGYRMLLSPYTSWYLDCGGGNWISGGTSWCAPFKSWQDVWSYTMAPSSGAPLTPAEEALIIGGETALWGEMVDHTVLLQRAFPRAAAGGERMWSNPDATVTWQDALPRLRVHRARLVARGIPAEPLQPTYCSEGVENTNCPWPA